MALNECFTSFFSEVLWAILSSHFFSFPKERIEQLVILCLLFVQVIHEHGKLKNLNVNIKKGRKLLFFLFFLISGTSVYVSYQRLNAEYFFTNALIAREKGDWKGVIKHARRAENGFYPIASNGIPLAWYIGSAFMLLNQLEDAYSYFSKAYNTTPYHPHVINNLAVTNIKKGKLAEAKELYEKALLLNPNFEDARINLSALYFKRW